MKKSFLQSNEWEDFQKAYGLDTFRVNDNLIIRYPLSLGKNYFACFFPDLDKNGYKELISELNDKKDGSTIFFHLEPIANIENVSTGNTCQHIQPQHSLILDISPDEEEILAGMSQKCRYNIRLAEKKGIKIKKVNNVDGVEIFYNLAKETANRSEFRYHSKKYYEKMIEVLAGKHNMLDLFVAFWENTPLVAIIIIYYQDQAIYLHGASSRKMRNLMAPNLAQFSAIREAKAKSCGWYDFWGVAPLEKQDGKFKIADPNHPWAGVTKFKLGFAPRGKYVSYPNCLEFVYDKMFYTLYKNYKKIK